MEHRRAFALLIAGVDQEGWGNRLAKVPIELHVGLIAELTHSIHEDRFPKDYYSFAADFPLLNQRLFIYCQAFDFKPGVLLMDLDEDPEDTCKWLADLPAVEVLVADYDPDCFSAEMSKLCTSRDVDYNSLIKSTYKRLREKLAVQSIQGQVAKNIEIAPTVAAPAKEQFDQLIRYGASLNNQFSKALGELRHVVAERQRLD
ncbi:MAG: hypothetical protein ABJ056_08650 [Halioglobus sp.]